MEEQEKHETESGRTKRLLARLGQAGTSLAATGLALHLAAGLGALLGARAFGLAQARVMGEGLLLGVSAGLILFAIGVARALSCSSTSAETAHKDNAPQRASDQNRYRSTPARVHLFPRLLWLLQGVWLLATAVAVVLLVWGRLKGTAISYPKTSVAVWAGVATTTACFVFYAFAKVLRSRGAASFPEIDTLCLWVFNSVWILLVGALSFLLSAASLQWAGPVALWLLSIWIFLLSLEMGLHAFVSFFRHLPPIDQLHGPVRPLLLVAFLSRKNPVRGLLRTVEDLFSADFRASWAIGLMKRSAGSLFLLLCLIFWFSTALVVIQPEEEGIKMRFGRLEVEGLPPGLHLKMPWPIDEVKRFPTRRILTFAVGYEPTGKPEDFIWSRPHGLQEHRFLIGNGNEIISIDAVIYFRVKELVLFTFQMANPLEAMEAIAYRVFMKETVLLTLDQLLSRDRAEFADRIHQRLQREVDGESLGLEIISVNLKSIHPPLDVAPAFQQVVSSFLAKESEILKGRAYEASTLPEAEAEAASRRTGARAYGFRRRGEALGKSSRFRRIAAVYRQSPERFRSRHRIEVIRDALGGKKVLVIDDRLFDGDVEQWIDMRPPGFQPPSVETAEDRLRKEDHF